uniref:HDC12143 n=1 Tax=Drosophila melanogaster TaxID=7227 RepID=Q6IKL7_DROME|nr:TPA_inf: HDC12143 [Drosophila melanogaster]
MGWGKFWRREGAGRKVRRRVPEIGSTMSDVVSQKPGVMETATAQLERTTSPSSHRSGLF